MAYELPSKSRSPDDGPTTIRDSAEIFGKVASINPEELVEEHGFQAIKAAIDQADQERIDATGEGYDEFYKELVEYGIRDTGRAIEDLAVGQSVEDRVEAIKDHRTLMALGLLAMRSEESMQGVLENDRGYGTRLEVQSDREGKPYLRMIEDDFEMRAKVNRKSGCPFAALNGDKLPSLPYIQFAVWSGEVMIRLHQRERDMRLARGY